MNELTLKLTAWFTIALVLLTLAIVTYRLARRFRLKSMVNSGVENWRNLSKFLVDLANISFYMWYLWILIVVYNVVSLITIFYMWYNFKWNIKPYHE